MKIKYILEDDLMAIWKNQKEFFKPVVLRQEKTLAEFFCKDDIIKDSSIEIAPFSFDMSQPKDKRSLTDLENIKRVYGHMRSLSDSQASDERIWAAYTLSEARDYMTYRWPATEVKDIQNRYLFGYGHQRSLFRNGVSRLWWIGRFSFDDTRDNPYELTEFLVTKQDAIEAICGRNVFNNAIVGRTAIQALADAEKNGQDLSRELVRGVGKYMNLLAGTYLIDSLSKEEVYNKIRKYIGF